MIRVEPLTGGALKAALPALARLRITVFREWPYLYDGSLEYEQGYLSKFSKAEGAVIVAARDGTTIVGVATASPMRGHADEFAQPFEARGYDVDRIFYFGESVLLPDYRGQGIGHAFFDHREDHARAQTTPKGRYTHTAFCGVVRDASDPRKPPGYRPLDAFWHKRGYRRMDGLVGHFGWQEVGGSGKVSHHMQFWLKELA